MVRMKMVQYVKYANCLEDPTATLQIISTFLAHASQRRQKTYCCYRGIIRIHRSLSNQQQYQQILFYFGAANYQFDQFLIMSDVQSWLLLGITNLIIITVQLTATKILTLLLITIIILTIYRRVMQRQPMDRIAIQLYNPQYDSLLIFELLSTLAHLLLHKQPMWKNVLLILGFILSGIASYYIPSTTLWLLLIDTIVILETKRNILNQKGRGIKSKLGIRQTQSIFYDSPQKSDGYLRIPHRQSPHQKIRH